MKTHREYLIDAAQRNAREALAQARSTLERALRELDHYTSRFDGAESLRDKADVMNWTLNALASSILPNLRLDLIASAQAELVRAHEVARAANQE
jgi:chlorite dismutase